MRLHRIHLKTAAGKNGHEGGSRQELIDRCLFSDQPCLAIGWSYLYNDYKIESFSDYLDAFLKEKSNGSQTKFKHSVPYFFSKLEPDDLIWARDLNGIYYLCRVTDKPRHFDCTADRFRLDIGAVIDVEVLKAGSSIPGFITSRFYSTNGSQPTLQAINNNHMLEYSQRLYNQLSGTERYPSAATKYDIFELLDAWDLEELVIDYLQVKYNYYLSKNSITRQDSTVKIECELFPRKFPRNGPSRKSAVVQVKVRRDTSQPWDYYDNYYFNENKEVFIFYADEDYSGYRKEIHTISRKELCDFIREHRSMLPGCISRWCDLCQL